MRRLTLMTGFLALLAGLWPAGSAPARAAASVTFRTDYLTMGAHGPFYLALERGYFAEEGLKVQILEGQGSNATIKLVGNGSDTFGLADYATAAKGVSEGVPVKAIYGILQTSPMVVISRADRPIANPKELEGKRIALAQGGSGTQIFPGVLRAGGVDPSRVHLVYAASAAKVTSFLQGKVDAITGYLVNEVPAIEAEGVQVHVLRYADHGVNTLSNGLLAQPTLLQQHPEVVRGFLRAVGRGFAEAMRNPAPAIEAIVKHRPMYQPKQAILAKQWELSRTLFSTRATRGKPMGWMAQADWEQTLEVLRTYTGLRAVLPAERYYTNEFVPAQ